MNVKCTALNVKFLKGNVHCALELSYMYVQAKCSDVRLSEMRIIVKL